MTIAMAVATCIPTMNARYGDFDADTSRSLAHDPPISAGMSTLCPRLESGNSSVTPWMRPTTPASPNVRCDMPHPSKARDRFLAPAPRPVLARSSQWGQPSHAFPGSAIVAAPVPQALPTPPLRADTSRHQDCCGGYSDARYRLVLVPGIENANPNGLPYSGDLGGVLGGAAADLGAEPDQRVVLAAGHALLQRDQGVVGDLDVLGAYLGAALGDVAQPEAEVILRDRPPVSRV